MTSPQSSDSTAANQNSTQRFSNRVDNYVRFRPRYPQEIITLLQKECGLTRESVVADIGSGTGFLTKLFLGNGNPVFGVEPNREMRAAGEQLLKDFPQFVSVNGTAEATTLPNLCADFVVAGQAFHWFDHKLCRAEFARILRPSGWVILIWNDRKTDTTPFLVDYEFFLKTFSTDYSKVDHKRVNAVVLEDFFGFPPRKASFPNQQHFDFAGLKGRALSSSYIPEAGQPKHEEMLKALRSLFDKHQQRDQVTLDYDATVYFGKTD